MKNEPEVWLPDDGKNERDNREAKGRKIKKNQGKKKEQTKSLLELRIKNN